MTRTICAALLALSLPAGAAAEGLALLIGNSDYAHAPDAVTAANDTRHAARLLGEAGYEVLAGSDLDRAGLAGILREFAAKAPTAAPVVVYYSGHTVRADGRTYLAPVDLEAGDRVSLLLGAIPLEALTEAAWRQPGQAVLFLDAAQSAGFAATDGIDPGFADPGELDDLLIVSATAPGRAVDREGRKFSRFHTLVTEGFLAPGARVAEIAEGAGERAWATGAVSEDLVLVPAPVATAPADDIAQQIEIAFWQSAERSGRADDFEAYLARYPEGAFANLARNRLGLPEVTASTDPRVALEQSLDLTRSQKRRIQQTLTWLGHDPRGIDGIFGPGSRAAIRAWQAAEGRQAPGYLAPGEVARLETLHDREAKRVEAEARQADQAHWLATGKDGTREGYRAYLERYPEGIHAEKALAGLDRLAAASDRAEERAERVAFREAEAAGTREAYRRFLTRYPAGNYQAQAERELARLDAR
ncbi:MAG: caspase family protein [Pseudomonadota bacterium]